MKKHTVLRALVACAASGLLLAGCGGGGDSGGSAPAPAPGPSGPFTPSAQLEGSVAGCSLNTQKQFIRSYMDEVYLFYNEIPNVNAAAFNNIPDYFNALLVRTPDANGVPKDQFSAVIPSAQADGSLARGASLSLDPAQLLSAGTGAFVPQVFNSTTGSGRKFGYIQFNDHDVGAQDQLITAFRAVRDAGAQDLVLDLRFNSGGFLYIAQSAASMVTGPANNGKVFEQLRYNDKRTAETNASALFFTGVVETPDTSATHAAQYPAGTPLPQLGLPRVFVLTSGRTCSASESIINSLRGVDVQVIRVGSTTCGKPYGFREKDNCGWAYFPIEFKGSNAKGFGDYTTGFAPNCAVQDDPAQTAGGPGDPLLTAAKFYMDNNRCPDGITGGTIGVQGSATPILRSEKPRRPAWFGRLLRPDQR